MDDLAHFRCQIFSPGPKFPSRYQVRGPNCTKLGEDTEGSSLSYEFVSDFRYHAAFSNAGRSKSSDVENDAKFLTF